MLTPISDAWMEGRYKVRKFLCECGNEAVKRDNLVRTGNTRSCGCLGMASRREAGLRRATHGATKTRTYRSWHGMIARCTKPEGKRYHRYGGRGITVCPQWLNNFPQFLADMGAPPTPDHSLERVDNNAGYSPENCVWATRAAQARNRHTTLLYELDGKTVTIGEAAARNAINYATLYRRVVRLGIDMAEAVKMPVLVR